MSTNSATYRHRFCICTKTPSLVSCTALTEVKLAGIPVGTSQRVNQMYRNVMNDEDLMQIVQKLSKAFARNRTYSVHNHLHYWTLPWDVTEPHDAQQDKEGLVVLINKS